LKEEGIKTIINSPLFSPTPDLNKFFAFADDLGAIFHPDPIIFEPIGKTIESHKPLNLNEIKDFIAFMIKNGKMNPAKFYAPIRKTENLCKMGCGIIHFGYDGSYFH